MDTSPLPGPSPQKKPIANLGTVPLHCDTDDIVRASLQVSSKRILTSPLAIAAVALVLRITVLYVSWHRASPAEATGPYGFEAGRVAESIVSGRGFSSPFPFFETGPTAWLSPIYPYFLGGIFKVWGVYSTTSHVVAQSLNCLFSALTVFPIYGSAKRTFGVATAVFSSWLWVILPNAWHFPIAYIWDTSLAALWFALLFWATLALCGERRLGKWAGYGALWTIGASISASLLSVLPFFLLWLAWQTRKQSLQWLRLATTAALIFALGMAPWTLRNYRAFGKFIPTRSNFGYELWIGNNPAASDWKSFSSQPTWDQSEAAEYAHLGEISYVQAKGHESLVFIRSHPAKMVESTFGRAMSYWLSASDRPGETWSGDPPYVKALLLMNAGMVLLCLLGIVVAGQKRNRLAAPYLFVLLFYPAIFCVTHPLVRYRFPMEPIVVILAAYGLVSTFSLFAKRPLSAEGAQAIAR
jgi:4-amino-4-deoxy-L-arabinose transferase-like glycosyltransferase